MRRLTVLNLLWGWLHRILQALLGATWICVVPRVLSPHDYGQLLVLVALNFLIYLIGLPGIDAVFGRLVPQYAAQGDTRALEQLQGSFFWVKQLLAFPLAAVAVAGTRLLPSTAPLGWPGAACAGAIVWLMMTQDIFFASLFGGKRMGAYISRLTWQLGGRLVLVLLLGPRWGLEGLMYGYVLLEGIILVYAWRTSRMPLCPAWPRGLQPGFGGLLWFAFQASALPGALMSLSQGGSLVLGGLGRDPAEIAMYGIAGQISATVNALLTLAATAMLPSLSALLAAHEFQQAETWTRRVNTYQQLGAVAALGGVLLVGAPILRLVLGSRYDGVWLLTVVALSATLPVGTWWTLNYAAAAWGRPRLNLVSSLVLAGGFFVCAVSFGWRWGALGCAAAMPVAGCLAAAFTSHRYAALVREGQSLNSKGD